MIIWYILAIIYLGTLPMTLIILKGMNKKGEPTGLTELFKVWLIMPIFLIYTFIKK